MDAHAIHVRLGADGWREVLLSVGIGEQFLRNKHGPCPACGGKDRFRFDNRHGRGDYFCSQCGAGDGFRLIMNAQGVSFAEARAIVLDKGRMEARPVQMVVPDPPAIAKPTRRVLQLLRECCAVEDCDEARRYLASRSLWPLPKGHGLKAHPSVAYFQERNCVGRYPALVAAVRDMAGELVTVHVTYLDPRGGKLQGHEPRKILSAMTGREGCAVPLIPIERDVLGIAEGIETAFSAALMHSVPVWAALNTSLLQKFEPPERVCKLVIFADRDVAGLQAAAGLMERLQERVRLELRTPQAKDWNDVLRAAA